MIFVSRADNRRVVREEGGPVCRVSDRSVSRGRLLGAESGDYLDT